MIVSGLERLCTMLDRIPAWEDGHFYPQGFWGCRWGWPVRRSVELDEQWGTGRWRNQT